MAESTRDQDEALFTLKTGAAAVCTECVGSFSCPPSCLVELFGKPGEGDGNKVSGEYVFEGPNGEVFTVYDWKATTLYWGRGAGCPTPRQFWASEDPEELQVGSNGKASPKQFLEWIARRQQRHDAVLAHLINRLEDAARRHGRPFPV